MNGYINIVDYLVQSKSDIKMRAHSYPAGTALHCAANEGHLNVVKYFLTIGVDVDTKDMDNLPNYSTGHLFIMPQIKDI